MRSRASRVAHRSQLSGAMYRIICASLLALAGCKLSSSHPDGGPMQLSGSMCTTQDCASNPCTPGCVFAAKSGNCPSEFPTTVAITRVTSCPNRCGLRMSPYEDQTAPTPGGYCWKFDASAPGCVVPKGCGYSSPECYPIDNSFEAGGASICAADETCTDGATISPGDAGIICDMSVPTDMTSID